MNDETKIPLLQDLLFKGQPDEIEKEYELSLAALTINESTDVEIEQDDVDSEIGDEQESLPEEITDRESDEELPAEIKTKVQKKVEPQELIQDEEIRKILDKYMDKAYKKIIRLLNERES